MELQASFAEFKEFIANFIRALTGHAHVYNQSAPPAPALTALEVVYTPTLGQMTTTMKVLLVITEQEQLPATKSDTPVSTPTLSSATFETTRLTPAAPRAFSHVPVITACGRDELYHAGSNSCIEKRIVRLAIGVAGFLLVLVLSLWISRHVILFFYRKMREIFGSNKVPSPPTDTAPIATSPPSDRTDPANPDDPTIPTDVEPEKKKKRYSLLRSWKWKVHRFILTCIDWIKTTKEQRATRERLALAAKKLRAKEKMAAKKAQKAAELLTIPERDPDKKKCRRARKGTPHQKDVEDIALRAGVRARLADGTSQDIPRDRRTVARLDLRLQANAERDAVELVDRILDQSEAAYAEVVEAAAHAEEVEALRIRRRRWYFGGAGGVGVCLVCGMVWWYLL